MNEKNYSVLMSVYYKEKPEYLLTSMESMFNQTIPTNDFVLVCDGPLNEELNAVIKKMQKKFGDVLNVVRLEENVGLGKALNIGLEHCKNDLIARMDSDDISYPNRCEKEIEVFCNNSQVDIVSGIVEEFSVSTDYVETRRVLPEKHTEIIAFAKKRNPFNHPCVMYRKSAVEAAGGYQDFYLLEDYYLWIRMLMNKCIGYNLQEPLLWMRAGTEMYNRRGGWKYAESQYKLFSYMKEINYISRTSFITSVLKRCVISSIPNELRKLLFKVMVRK